MATVTPGGRSLSETVAVVRGVVWTLFAACVAVLVLLTVAGFVLAASDPLPLLGFLAVALLGTLTLGVADVVFG